MNPYIGDRELDPPEESDDLDDGSEDFDDFDPPEPDDSEYLDPNAP